MCCELVPLPSSPQMEGLVRLAVGIGLTHRTDRLPHPLGEATGRPSVAQYESTAFGTPTAARSTPG